MRKPDVPHDGEQEPERDAQQSERHTGETKARENSRPLEQPRLDEVEVRRRNQLISGMWVKSPARARLSALAAARLGKLSMEKGLGTDRPTNVVVLTDRNNLYLIPVGQHHNALPVLYSGNNVSVNLNKVFTFLNRLVPPHSQEFYRVDIAEEPLMLDGVEVQALRVPLKRLLTRHKQWKAEGAGAEAAAELPKRKRTTRKRRRMAPGPEGQQSRPSDAPPDPPAQDSQSEQNG
jgi:hypothetical protein